MQKGTSLLTAAALTATIFTTPVAFGYEAGDWLVRGRIIAVSPNDSSNNFTSSTLGTLNATAGVNSDVVPEIDFTYMLSRHWGVELILASSEHDIKAKGALAGLGNIIDTRTLPPTLTLQYHFRPDAKYRPYVGVGVNYTLFFSEDASRTLKAAGGGKANVDLDSSFGLAAQIGMDVGLNDDWFLNFDVKYIDMKTDASVSTAALGKLKIDVDIDPIVYGIGIGKRF